MNHSRLSTWFKPGTSMWFVEFMQQALYHPKYGYYTRAEAPFGKTGDFVTAPELTPLFGQTLAKVCADVFRETCDPVCFEFGAGSGRLCVDILSALAKMDSLPSRYIILEASHSLKAKQQTLIKAEIPHLLKRVEWMTRWPEQPFEGIVIANEVLDAMPVHRFRVEGETILESQVERTMAGTLIENWMPCPHERIKKHIAFRRHFFSAPYESECNGLLDDWLKGCAKMLLKGLMLIIDYGFPACEYYHPDRSMGTLMCHHRHRMNHSPFENIGEQDITAHVDFTHVAEAASAADFHVAWFAHQASFLLDNGLLDQLALVQDTVLRFNANQKVNLLLSPSEMGELFKVMVLTKALAYPLTWHPRHDRRVSL